MVASGLTSATPRPGAATPPTWAYGELRTVDFRGVAGAYTYEGSATIGYSVIFNETQNLSGGILTVNAVRTIGLLENIRYCLPSCSAPRIQANFSDHAFESTDAWANLTTDGTVTEPHGTAPALALLNSTVRLDEKLRESEDSSSGSTVLRDRLLDVNVSGTLSVNLSTPLGLFPLNVSAGDTWSSASTYTAVGNVAWAWFYDAHGTLIALPGPANASGKFSVTGSGAIGVAGSYRAGTEFAYRGAAYPAANLTITGPFSLEEGAILVPASADLFASATHPWSTEQAGTAIVTTSMLDVHAGSSYEGHLPIVASGFDVQSASSNAAADVAPAAAGAAPAMNAPAAGGTNSTTIQGEPETPAAATSEGHCLMTGLGCPLAGGPNSPLRFFLLVGAVATVGVLIAAVVMTRRRPPAPVYPNAALYPPGGRAGDGPSPAPEPAPAEDDPLGHLW